MNPPHYKHCIFFLAGLWLITLAGITSVPLETHEAYVLATAQQMRTSGDWILPKFNQNVRLQKPPLNYWITACVSKLDPHSRNVEIWHGRLVSLLAGLIMVLATLHTGNQLYSRQTGLLAAVFVMCTQGFIRLSHNARPDFLYASLCALHLLAWIEAWKANDGTWRQHLNGVAGWLAAALATLAKGPQVPVVFLLGFLIFLLTEPDRKRVFRILHPLSGLTLFCLIVLPWWILLNYRLGALGLDISSGQLSGSLLAQFADWKELLSGYYFLVLPVLMFPISIIFPLAIITFFKNRHQKSASTKLLLVISVTFLIVFTLGGHYRKHYLLPLFPFSSVLLAQTINKCNQNSLPFGWKRAFTAISALFAFGIVGLMIFQKAYGLLLFLFLSSAILVFLLKNAIPFQLWKKHLFTAQILTAASVTTFLFSAYNACLPTPRQQSAEQEIAEHIGHTLTPEDLLVEWDSSLKILPYYIRQGVVSFSDREKLKIYLIENSGSRPTFAVIPASELGWFRQAFKTEVLLTSRYSSRRKTDIVFVKILGVQSRSEDARHLSDTPLATTGSDRRLNDSLRFIRVVITLAGLFVAIWLWKKVIQDYLIPKRWDTVKKGRIYRSGRLKKSLIRRTLERQKIDVIIDLTKDNPQNRDQAAEKKAADHLKIKLLRFPLCGNGTGDVHQYADAIAAVICSEKQGCRILIHCAAGVQRTGGVIAFYRLLIEKKPLATVVTELRQNGFNPKRNRELLPYITENIPRIATILREKGHIIEIPELRVS